MRAIVSPGRMCCASSSSFSATVCVVDAVLPYRSTVMTASCFGVSPKTSDIFAIPFRMAQADVWWVITWSMSWIEIPTSSSTSRKRIGVVDMAAWWIPLASVNIRAPGSAPFG